MPPKGNPSTGQERELSKALGQLSFKDDLLLTDAHPRPGFGTAGTPIKVEANMYQVRFSKSTTIQHYDLHIEPVVKSQKPKMPKPLAAKIWEQVKRGGMNSADKVAFSGAAFDLQKNVYTTTKFTMGPNGKKDMTVTVPEDDAREPNDHSRFKITLQHANTVDLDSVSRFCQGDKQTVQEQETVLTAIQAVNILLRDDPQKHYVPKGARGRFFGMDGAVDISGGAIVGKGFMQSFRPTQSGFPAIQLDMAHTAFFKGGNLLERIPHLLGQGGGGRGGRGGPRGGRGCRGGPPGGSGSHVASPDQLNRNDVKQLSKLLYGASFRLPYKNQNANARGKAFKIKKLSEVAADDISFTMQGRDGAPDRRVTVMEYFKQQYNITIRKPRMPCVVYGKNFMVPVELAVIDDFNAVPFSMLSGDQAADMIKHAAQRPMDRSASIKQWFRKLDYASKPLLQQWGLEVRNQMMEVDARVLPAPKVTYRNNKTLNCQFGGWNLRGVSFTRPGNALKSWGVLSLDGYFRTPDMARFITFFNNEISKYGVRVENKQPPLVEGDPRKGLKANLQEVCREAYMKAKANPQLILIIMPRRDVALYQEIKNIAAMQLKQFVPTQCLVAQKLKNDRGLDQYCGNFAMKIQSKLGGVTHEVPIPQALDKTTMMIGADVTHPPAVRAGESLHPSIAVTVGAKTGDNVTFRPCVRLQQGRMEIIADLHNMVMAHFKEFEANTKAPPAKIVFFRDGVSEGQYAAVCKEEVAAITAAAAKYKAGYKPKITFVICAKRHNMRFFPKNERDADRTGNLNAGLVVDRGVTHPFAFDFYLQAHAGLQGTARPTHYIVLRDENGYTADKMQNMCNHLCYSYARATRAVSMIPVAYYAHIIAEQCRYMAYSDDGSSDSATTTSGGRSGTDSVIKTRAYDAMQIQARLDDSDSASKVSWYM